MMDEITFIEAAKPTKKCLASLFQPEGVTLFYARDETGRRVLSSGKMDLHGCGKWCPREEPDLFFMDDADTMHITLILGPGFHGLEPGGWKRIQVKLNPTISET